MFFVERKKEDISNMRKRLALLLATAMIACSISGCGGSQGGAENGGGSSSSIDTMVLGVNKLNGVFNQMFSTSAFDDRISDKIFSNVCQLDKDGKLVDNAGHVETEEIKAKDGHEQVKYTVSIKKDMKFSDGEPVTIDDVLFYYYVCADPTYDGNSTLSQADIVGMKEYYYDTKDYKKLIKEIEDKYSPENISEEDFIKYLIDTKCADWFDDTLPGDVGDGRSWAEYLKDEGYDASSIKKPEEMLELLAKCEYEKYAENYDPLSYYKQKVIKKNLGKGTKVEKISGIEKVDDYTCTVLFDSVSIKGDREVSWIPITPVHYYGKDFKKGDLSSIKALNGKPLGSGPFTFKKYDNNLVSLDANPYYFEGEPKIAHLKFQVVNDEDKLDLLAAGDVDITDPSASLEIVEQIKDDDNLTDSLVDNPGYGYIGLSAERIPDKNVRKGLMHLMNRAPAVQSYYGELAEVIERPMTPTLAEYPNDAKEYYGYDKEKAKEYFEKAGYKKVDGKLVKDGKQLKITVGIGEASSHPSTPILTQMANDLKSLGGELAVNDLEPNVLFNKVQGGELDMWVQAWGNSTDCDLTQIYGSKGGSNYSKYYDSKIDDIQAEILQTLDLKERSKLVAKELDMIMDAAICMPVYQRKNLEVYNAANINIDTLPKNITTYTNILQYSTDIEKVEMN